MMPIDVCVCVCISVKLCHRAMRLKTLDTLDAAGSSRTPAQGGGKLTYRVLLCSFSQLEVRHLFFFMGKRASSFRYRAAATGRPPCAPSIGSTGRPVDRKTGELSGKAIPPRGPFFNPTRKLTESEGQNPDRLGKW